MGSIKRVKNRSVISFLSLLRQETLRKMVLIRYALVSLLAILAFVNADEELYSDKYDYIDPYEIVNNDRLRDQYYNCFMDTGPCVTPDAVFFKGNFPEAVVTKCKKCTEKQKENFEKIAVWYDENRPAEWSALIMKFIEEARKLNIESAK